MSFTVSRARLTPFVQAFLVLIGALTIRPLAADAHARLVASSPAAGQRIDSAVRSVTLTFDEPVEAALSSIRVLDAAGVDRSVGPLLHPDVTPQTLIVRTAPLRHGRFVVAWRVLSADSHLVDGAFAVGVGETAGQVPPSLARPPEPGLALLLAILHIGEIASLLTAIGTAIAAIVVPGSHPRSAPIGRGAWIALSAIAFVRFFGQAEALGVEPILMLKTRPGALPIALVLGGLLGFVASRARSRALLFAAAATVVLADVMSGHAATGAAPALGIVVESIHLVAAAAWIGVLLVALGDPTAEMKRIGAVAAASVLVLALTAIPQAWRNIATASALATSMYGLLVCMKAGVFALALAAAAVSQWRLRRRAPLIGSVRVELALLAALTIVTGLLVDSAPPRPRAIQASQQEIGSFRLLDRRIEVTVATTGDRQYIVHILTTGSAGPSDLDDLRAWIQNREQGVGPLTVTLQRRGTGQYVGRAPVPFAGRWHLTVQARLGEFEERQHSFVLP